MHWSASSHKDDIQVTTNFRLLYEQPPGVEIENTGRAPVVMGYEAELRNQILKDPLTGTGPALKPAASRTDAQAQWPK